MAVSIDKVYQKVLAIANKEQRGYITPQEFNLFADQAQMEIFEQYFYDKNQFGRVPGNNHMYSDMLSNLQEKIDLFNKDLSNAEINNNYGDIKLNTTIPDLYRLGRVKVTYAGHEEAMAEYIDWKENILYGKSPLAKWSKNRPVYNKWTNQAGDDLLKIRPYPEDGVDIVRIFYTKKPSKPNWGYVVVNDKPLYNADTSTNFELHPAEGPELVYKILTFAGIAIEKPGLVQVAAGLEAGKIQQEKQ